MTSKRFLDIVGVITTSNLGILFRGVGSCQIGLRNGKELTVEVNIPRKDFLKISLH